MRLISPELLVPPAILFIENIFFNQNKLPSVITIECNECLETFYLSKNSPITSTPFSGMYFLLSYLLSAGPVACIHHLLICPIILLGQFGGVRERVRAGFYSDVSPWEGSSLPL